MFMDGACKLNASIGTERVRVKQMKEKISSIFKDKALVVRWICVDLF